MACDCTLCRPLRTAPTPVVEATPKRTRKSVALPLVTAEAVVETRSNEE